MFNFLVKGNEWDGKRDTVFGSRLFECTEQRLIDQFRQDGRPDLAALAKLPTLFVEETSGFGNQVAHVGEITKTRMSGRDILLEYVYYSDIPPITNKALQSFAADLDIDGYQFSRTHWSVKDVDLFRILLRKMPPPRQNPKVFQLAHPEVIDSTLVSAMMPFHPGFDDVYKTLQATATAAEMHCLRASDFWESPTVIQDIVRLIDKSSIVICDCTGRNPNVFYEIGIAHSLGREVILITQNEDDIPFDLRHLRFVKYLNNKEGRDSLGNQLLTRLEHFA